ANAEHRFEAAFFFGEREFLGPSTATTVLRLNGYGLRDSFEGFGCFSVRLSGFIDEFGHRIFQLVEALAADRRDLKDPQSTGFQLSSRHIGHSLTIWQIHLIDDRQLWSFIEWNKLLAGFGQDGFD